MKNILATWICIDDLENASWFPSAKGKSSDQSVQDIYWRCLSVCMFSARFFNPSIRLVVFSNTDKLPIVDGLDFKQLFADINIEFHVTPFEYQTPEGYYKGWKNQFYEFSILKYIKANPDFDLNENFCLIDSDCVITGDLSEMYRLIEQHHFIGYDINYKEDYVINGISRNDMKGIFEKLANIKMQKTPVYYAGEYLGVKISVAKALVEEFDITWTKLNGLFIADQPRLNEEAHVLSYLYFRSGYENNYANTFVKRMWTTTFRNIQPTDKDFVIWHLPAEKIYGFKKMYNWLFLKPVKEISNVQLLKKMQDFFTVTKLPLKLKLFYALKRTGKRLLKK